MLEEKLKEKIINFANAHPTMNINQDVIRLSDAISICKEEIDKAEIDNRNIGAELMAKKILEKLKYPNDGKFGCEEANQIIDYHKEKIISWTRWLGEMGWYKERDNDIWFHDNETGCFYSTEDLINHYLDTPSLEVK
jgi:hypothetical protein